MALHRVSFFNVHIVKGSWHNTNHKTPNLQEPLASVCGSTGSSWYQSHWRQRNALEAPAQVFTKLTGANLSILIIIHLWLLQYFKHNVNTPHIVVHTQHGFCSWSLKRNYQPVEHLVSTWYPASGRWSDWRPIAWRYHHPTYSYY